MEITVVLINPIKLVLISFLLGGCVANDRDPAVDTGNEFSKDEVIVPTQNDAKDGYGIIERDEHIVEKDGQFQCWDGFGWMVFEDADPKTFTIIEDDIENRKLPLPYAKDRNNVYVKCKKVKLADPSTFEVLFDNAIFRFSRDKYSGFYNEKKIEGSDGETFKYLDGYCCAKDKNKVYIQNKIILEADSDSFEMIEYPYAKDKNYVYHISIPDIVKSNEMIYEIIPTADPRTFQPLSCGYSKDINSAYFRAKKIEESHVDSFEVIPEFCDHVFYARDKNHIYRNGEDVEGLDLDDYNIEQILDIISKS